jgi:D-alanyl-D-alanine carboxypeptidase
VQNTNRRLLDAYQGADGIKTGYTRAAGFNLVSSAQRGDRRVIVSHFGGQSAAGRNAEVSRLMDMGFAQMPARVAVASLPPLRLADAPAPAATAAMAALAPAPAPAPAIASLALAPAATGAPEPAAEVTILARAERPMPRSGVPAVAVVSRNADSIARAIAEVNAGLEQGSDPGMAIALSARPAPRPGAAAPGVAVAAAGLGSTFAAQPSAARTDAGVRVAGVDPGSTGGNAWGVQLGAFRAKGDAERHLLATALRDVPELAGGLRRIESAKAQGVTVFRAQFVGMSREAAVAACTRLAREQAECTPIEPGV